MGVTAPPLAISILTLLAFLFGVALAAALVFIGRYLLKKSKMVKNKNRLGYRFYFMSFNDFYFV